MRQLPGQQELAWAPAGEGYSGERRGSLQGCLVMRRALVEVVAPWWRWLLERSLSQRASFFIPVCSNPECVPLRLCEGALVSLLPYFLSWSFRLLAICATDSRPLHLSVHCVFSLIFDLGLPSVPLSPFPPLPPSYSLSVLARGPFCVLPFPI